MHLGVGMLFPAGLLYAKLILPFVLSDERRGVRTVLLSVSCTCL